MKVLEDFLVAALGGVLFSTLVRFFDDYESTRAIYIALGVLFYEIAFERRRRIRREQQTP